MTRRASSSALLVRRALTRFYGPPVRDEALGVDLFGACPVCGAGDDLYRPVQVSDVNGLFCAATWCAPSEIASRIAALMRRADA